MPRAVNDENMEKLKSKAVPKPLKSRASCPHFNARHRAMALF